jgi:hypothetical protein
VEHIVAWRFPYRGAFVTREENMRAFATWAIGFAAVLLAALTPGVSASAAEGGHDHTAVVQRIAAETGHDHWAAMQRLCQAGLTPEATQGHEVYVAAWDREGVATEFVLTNISGGNPGSSGEWRGRAKRNVHPTEGGGVNFAGPVPLEMTYARCNQAR